MKAILFSWAIALSLISVPAAAQTYPALTGRVVDEANVIPPAEEAALDTQLEGIETRTGHQFVVATVKDLQGYDVADYGIGLGRHWGIGKKGADDGVLLLVAPNERRVYIAVGYGLNSVFTDIHAGRIIRGDITPRFKDGDMPGGIQAGVNAIAEQIQLTPEEAAARAAQIEAEERDRADDGDIGGLIFVAIIIFFFFILPILSSLGRKGRKRRRKNSPWGAPIIIWGNDDDWGGGSSGGSSWGGWSSGGGGGGGFGGFSGGGGSFGGGGASGGW
ncbi:methanol dehydrogenase [Sphingopyxis sp. QXT-31]|uniref:TPM domain-containing protein n=1 Tax=Sphingopyxis sp. QXT-31 TaxID=1357916 RepID=UPI0009792237|nr:TPM domain-containing protein [Sphingopyxis sp. QXT-31]APZ98864.1 methanol dehydrogenase [Sphingopyxis sp. QXT-31]